MNPFTTKEINALRAEIVSAMGDDTAIGFDAVLASIPSGSDPTARTTVIQSLACRNIHQLDEQEKERAGMATVAKALRCECEVNALIRVRHRLIVGDDDYRIYGIQERPKNSAPLYYVLYLEDES